MRSIGGLATGVALAGVAVLVLGLVFAAAGLKTRVGGIKLKLAGNISIRDLSSFSLAFSQRAVDYMKSNYSGDPSQLEGALRGLLPIAREMARQQPYPIEDDLLGTIIVTTVAVHHFAPRDQVESAMESILRAERQSA